VKGDIKFSLAHNRPGIYFNDGEGIIWFQNHEKGPANDRLKSAIKAARDAFFESFAPQVPEQQTEPKP
jgi:hypothetical protein